MSQKQFSPVQVLIASTLKPVRDVRAYEKLAFSLGETSKYRLNIIGFSDEKAVESGNYRFFSSMSHFGSTVDRLLAQVRFAKKLLDLKPKLLICCTYEYLPLASFFKSFLKYRLVYDVQENYITNLDLNPSLNEVKKKWASYLIRKAEGIKGIDLYLLAETCYSDEMPEKTPFLVLENKYQGAIKEVSQVRLDPTKDLKFCITGTLTPAYGTLEGLIWFQKILEAYPHFQLKVIGHCPLDAYKIQLLQQAINCPQIHLEISNSPIAYYRIEQVVINSDAALLPYVIHPAIQEKIPTKLYECAALGIPVLMTNNPTWVKFINSYQGGIAVDFFDKENALTTFQHALDQTYFSTSVPESVLWKSQKLLFQQAIQKLLS